MYFIYNIFINLVFLFSPVLILFRLIKDKEDPNRYLEKFCVYKKKNNLKSVWFHAASVGELMSFSDDGALQIKLDSGIGKYQYILPAQSK